MYESVTDSQFVIAAAQVHSVAGDLDKNVQHHVQLIGQAAQQGAHVVVFPELSLTGYEPQLASELAVTPDDDVVRPLQEISDSHNIAVIAGCPLRSTGHKPDKPHLGALVVHPSRSPDVYHKRFLHMGEEQYFVAGRDAIVSQSHGHSIGLAICADICNPQHPKDVETRAHVYAAGVAMTPNGIADAEKRMATYAQRHRFLAVMANYGAATGGYEMAGKSAVWNQYGELLAQADDGGESLVFAESSDGIWQGRVVAL